MRELMFTAAETWQTGGLLMLPLWLMAVLMYYTALDLLFLLGRHPWMQVAKGTDLTDEVRDVLNRAKGQSSANIAALFAEVRRDELAGVNRRIRFLSALIPAGPLLGLLGTVMGMLSTFRALGSGAGDKLESMIGGISEALLTTQIGLVIAVPALVILSLVIRRRNRLAYAVTKAEGRELRRVLREAGT